MFVKKIIDYEFEEQIDENLDIFAMSNGIIAIDSLDIRLATPRDYVMNHCGWKYDIELSEKYMNNVKEFFEKLFPIKEERRVALTFFASPLHGHRLDKKFMILIDKRDGNNGKSTLLNLLRTFFGNYLKGSTKFLCKASFDKDKDSHDGGLEPFKGKRVLLADELKKHMRIDEGLLKNIAGGQYVVEGRKFNSIEQFKFTWQAGIIMVFNESDCPRFDSTDSAFMKHMLVYPMRSKFIHGINDDYNSHTYNMDAEIGSKFKN